MATEILWLQANPGDEELVAATTARQNRQLIDVLLAEGVIEGFAASEHADAWKVTVAAGRAVVSGDDQADQGKYLVTKTTAEDVALNPPPGSNKRIDVIYLQVHDPNAGGDDGYTAVYGFVEGATHATDPVAPAVPDTAIAICSVLRESSDATWADASITDLRTIVEAPAVNATTPPTTGQMLVYNETTGVWVPTTVVTTGALTRAGGQTTEASTTSTAEVDMLVSSALNIPVDQPFEIHVNYRKTGTAGVPKFGLKLNSNTAITGRNLGVATTAKSGVLIFDVAARPSADYAGMILPRHSSNADTTPAFLEGGDRVNAAVTSVTIRGSVANAADTLYFDSLHIYTKSTA